MKSRWDVFDGFFGALSDPDIDIVFICNFCKKKIGLERRFLSAPMKLECPYCKKSLAITPEVLREKKDKDS